MPEASENTNLKELVEVLTDDPVQSPEEVFRRCQALEQLSASGTPAIDALPAIIQSLVVRVSVDCVLELRVAAAEAVWKVGRRHDLALPFLTRALKDEYWGVSRKAAEVLWEMGSIAHDAIPDLVNLADRRLDHGPFHYEEFGDGNSRESLLAIIARAIGNCGQGLANAETARRTLRRIVDCESADANAAAQQAIKQLIDLRT